MTFKKLFAFGLVAAVLGACGDDSSSNSATNSDEDSSSSVCEDCDGSSSSKAKSSSSSAKSSSSSAKSSNSVASSSSVLEGYVDPSTVVKGTMTDERDGQSYKTVKIGTQTWMAENLNYAYTGVPYKFVDNESKEYTSDSTSLCYNNDPSNCTKYGRLYTWAAAMDSAGFWSVNGMGCGYYKICMPTYPVRGVCPEGWHMPSKDEWGELLNFVGQLGATGSVLKSTVGWKDSEDGSGNGYDSFGFSAIPAGKGSPYDGKGFAALFWSSSTNNGDMYSFRVNLCHNYYYHFLDLAGRDWAYSVRCVKD